MGRTTKSLSGGGKDKLLRALVGRESEIAAMPAERLLLRLSEALTEVRVKRDVWETVTRVDAALPTVRVKRSRDVKSAAASILPAAPTNADIAENTSKMARDSFDPFAFSALAILTRKGREGLAVALADVDTAEHLHALAAAQHLSIDRDLSDTAQLRDAIVTATEARLKERRAAAS